MVLLERAPQTWRKCALPRGYQTEQDKTLVAVENYLQENYGISVHYSSTHANYYTAWRYVTKQDREYEESEGHPDLRDYPGPSTAAAHEAMERKRKSRRAQAHDVVTSDEDLPETNDGGEKKKRKRLSAFEVSEIILSNELRDRTELLAYANMQRQEGKTDLAEFVMNRGTKVVNELISNTWEMKSAKETLERRKQSRVEILQDALLEKCSCETERAWQKCARELLKMNCVTQEEF